MTIRNAFLVILVMGFMLAAGLSIQQVANSGVEEPLANLHSFSDDPLVHRKGKRQEGPALFAEYHQLIRTREGEERPAYAPGYRLKAYRKALLKRPKTLNTEPLPWRERGPANVGGRTRGLWVDPTDEQHLTWYAGSVGGGVWKTEDGGATWRHLTNDLTSLSTSAIAGSPANPEVLYVGTGEGFNTADISGNGIWKSTDRGENWFPLENTVDDPRFVHIMRMVVNPGDENEIVVATRVSRRVSTGEGDPRSYILKSTDGGKTWRQRMASTFVAQQLVAQPNNFDTLYAAMNSLGVARSVDAGESWDTVFNITGLSLNRIELAVSPTDPKVIYLAAYSNQQTSKLYRSQDYGEEWYEVQGIDNQNRFGNWMGGQGWYNNTLAVHPFDPNTVLVGGQSAILRITVTDLEPDANNLLRGTMFPIADAYGQYANRFEVSSKGVHVDHHNLVLIPIDRATGRFYIVNANDGGIAFSPDSGETFFQTGDLFDEAGLYETNKGYNTAQFYGVDKMNGADRYVGGTQDNGSWVSVVDPDENSSWRWAPSGDGFEAAWHYSDPQKVLVSAQFNSIYRSDDGGATWRNVNPPGDGPFITRISNSKIDPEVVFGVSRQGVVRSLGFGDGWEVIDMPPGWRFSGAAQVRVSLASPLAVWSGSGMTADSRPAVSIDGGRRFQVTNFYDQATLGSISGLATHPANERTAYALFSMADGPKILRTTDLGENWEDISGFIANRAESTNGFPDVATYSLLVMPFDTNRIWAGTEIGLFESLDDGLSWQYADNGLPPVSIWDMKIVNDEVVLATHGRGVWSVALPELAGYEPPEADTYLPLLALDGAGLGGRIRGNYTLRSVYDSVFLEVGLPGGEALGETRRFPLEQGSEPVQGAFDLVLEELPEDTLVRAKVTVIAYQNGVKLINSKETLVFAVEEEVLAEYRTDFDDGRRDFARLGFNIYREPGFDNQALHSPHPYLGFYQTYLAVLQYPILVSESNPLITYDEIAMIEPGEPGTVFGDFEFWDYVVVEGTRDRGRTWEVIEGYDSRWSQNWVDNYVEDGGPVDPALFEAHAVDLTSVFNPGDTVFLRFLLQSDPYAEGWGWVIDNLNVQVRPTSNEELEVKPVPVISAFPNPTSSHIHLKYQLTKKETVRIDLYTYSGQQLSTLEEGIKPVGEYQLEFDAGGLEPGLYLFRVKVGENTQVVRWLKL